MVRVEMLNQHEGHPGAIGQRAQKLAAGIKAAGRSADADNEEVRVLAAVDVSPEGSVASMGDVFAAYRALSRTGGNRRTGRDYEALSR